MPTNFPALAASLGVTWFTSFIVQGLGYSQESAGWISTLPWAMGAVVVLATGWVSQALMTRGSSSRLARGVVGSAPLILGGLIVLSVPHVDSAAWKIALVGIGGGLLGSIFVGCPPIIAEFAPVSQRAAVIAIYLAIHTFAGVLAPAVNGSLIESAATPLDGFHRATRLLV